MVVRMMKWRPWPPSPASRKYEVRLVVKSLEGCYPAGPVAVEGDAKWAAEIRWKGPWRAALMNSLSLRRVAVRRNFTRGESAGEGGIIAWDEEFTTQCSLSSHRDNNNAFYPWEIAFAIFSNVDQASKNKTQVVAAASLNLAEFACVAEQKEFELNVPMRSPDGAANSSMALSIILRLEELRTAQEVMDILPMAIIPVASPPQAEVISAGKDDLSALKAGLKKVKIFIRRKKTYDREEGTDSRCSGQSDDCDYNSDYLPDTGEGESNEIREVTDVRNSLSYGTLAYVNYAGGLFYSSMRINADNEDWVYYSNCNTFVGSSHVEDTAASAFEQLQLRSSRRGILSWRKRKLNFRSPKAKGEPLLKKAYAEEGGDDIDLARRQLTSDDSLSSWWYRTEADSSGHHTSVSEFGDDNFAVGMWEEKEIVSRDGHMKLKTQVFFASIDQRSEQAAGESACTALVAVIADWFQENREWMPIKSQFDSLIRDGSLEWRNLCENERYRELFPDKHFDLETVLQAKIRPLTVNPRKSFIGFFRPECMNEENFNIFDGAMSFDDIWDEISHARSQLPDDSEPQLYIVSWNDHFFILRVEPEAYYIIDTLGERLYEGCTQAFILKFDSSTTILKLPQPLQRTSGNKLTDQEKMAVVERKDPNAKQTKPNDENPNAVAELNPDEPVKRDEVEEVLCRGKESCKEYIKSFLAAIPIRELQENAKKGLVALTPLHHRLQIEFHYTEFLQPLQAIASASDLMSEASETSGSSDCSNSGSDSLIEA